MYLLGAKQWPQAQSEAVWKWFMDRFERIYAQIKPDTLPFWEGLFNVGNSILSKGISELIYPCRSNCLNEIIDVFGLW